MVQIIKIMFKSFNIVQFVQFMKRYVYNSLNCGHPFLAFGGKCGVDETSLSSTDKYAVVVGDMNNTEDCKICLEILNHKSSFDETYGIVQLKKCGHKFHSGCVKMMVKGKDYIQCPSCRKIHGTKTGDQPLTGQMTWAKNPASIPGYAECGAIVIVDAITS